MHSNNFPNLKRIFHNGGRLMWRENKINQSSQDMSPKKSHLVDFGYFQIDQIEVIASLTQNNISNALKY
jgi:hypothetical protein